MPLAAYNIASGQGGNVVVGNVTVAVKEWSVAYKANVETVVLTDSVGCKYDANTYTEWEVSIEVLWNITAGSPYAVFVPGAAGTFVGNVGSTGKAASGTIRVLEANLKNSATALIPVTVKASGQGPLTLPV